MEWEATPQVRVGSTLRSGWFGRTEEPASLCDSIAPPLVESTRAGGGLAVPWTAGGLNYESSSFCPGGRRGYRGPHQEPWRSLLRLVLWHRGRSFGSGSSAITTSIRRKAGGVGGTAALTLRPGRSRRTSTRKAARVAPAVATETPSTSTLTRSRTPPWRPRSCPAAGAVGRTPGLCP